MIYAESQGRGGMEAIHKSKSAWIVFSLIIVFASSTLITFFALTSKNRPAAPGGERLHKPLEKRLVHPKIVVSKSRRRLYLYSKSAIVRAYRIGLGFQPAGHKVREGDGRTPEGKYYVCVKNPKSRYYLSLGLSYPNVRDAESGLRKGLITRRQYQEIAEAIRNGGTPPWDTALGGEVFIHGHGTKSDWTLGCIAMENEDIRELYNAVPVGTPVIIQPSSPDSTEDDTFASSVRHSRPTILIESSIDGGRWVKKTAIYPIKGQKVALRVDEIPGANIRWFQIVPDTSKIYKNANFPWEQNPYQWVGFAKIDYHKKELIRFRGHWEIEPFDNEEGSAFRDRESSSFGPVENMGMDSRFYHKDIGSFWFLVEIENEGIIYRSVGIEDSDHRGLSPQVFRVSIRSGEGYIGYLTSFFNVPGLFGSVTYQSNNYIGVDCADVLMAAYGKWKHKPIEKNYNVAMLVSQFPKVVEFDLLEGRPNKKLRWGKDVRPGDFVAVRYSGRKQYQHIGALFSDANGNSILDGGDLVIHAGPQPLHYSYLKDGNFDGHVAILRP